MNPDEAVAAGACLQAAILSEDQPTLERYKIREVTALSLGLSGYGNLTTVLIPRNSSLPVVGHAIMETIENDQTSVYFEIVEGERKNSIYNNKLGGFYVDKLPKQQAGGVLFSVNFLLDEDGILTVIATETSRRTTKNLIITMEKFRLSEHQIDVNINKSIKLKKEDDLFELFIIRRNYLINKCRVCEYNNDDAHIRQKCKDFVKFAESLDSKCN